MDNGIDWFFNFLYVKLASYPRQNNLAVALREVGRIERTLFIIEWILDTDMQRRAQIGLNCHERCNSDPHPTPEIRSRG
ncbi:TPA: Tn3 family transposase [Escherichia coli]|nr:Tn3 family transposase [Escherichia coli]